MHTCSTIAAPVIGSPETHPYIHPQIHPISTHPAAHTPAEVTDHAT